MNFRFSLYDLFIATSLIAAGTFVARSYVWRELNPIPYLPGYLLTGALIGAGVLAPAQRKLWGVWAGMLFVLINALNTWHDCSHVLPFSDLFRWIDPPVR